MAEIRFEPLDPRTWPGAPTPFRTSSRFGCGYATTVDELQRELRAVGATSAVIELELHEGDIRRDGNPYANAKPASPMVRLSFEHRKAGPLRFACDRYSTWPENLRAIVKTLEALRAVDRYGATRANEQYRGWARLPERAGAPFASAEAAARFLYEAAGLEFQQEGAWTRGPRAVDALYRAAAGRHHPDKGGDTARMARVNEARAKLLEAR